MRKKLVSNFRLPVQKMAYGKNVRHGQRQNSTKLFEKDTYIPTIAKQKKYARLTKPKLPVDYPKTFQISQV